MEISPSLNSSPVSEDLLEGKIEISPKKDFNFSTVGGTYLEKRIGIRLEEGL